MIVRRGLSTTRFIVPLSRSRSAWRSTAAGLTVVKRPGNVFARAGFNVNEAHLHPTIPLAPAVIGLLADTELFTHLADVSALAQQHIRFPQLVDYLFGVLSFRWHRSDLLFRLFITLDLDQEYRAGSPTYRGQKSFAWSCS